MQTLTINEKRYTHAIEVCRALRYEKKTADVMKQIFISENITDKHQFLNGGPCKLTKRLAETQLVHQ